MSSIEKLREDGETSERRNEKSRRRGENRQRDEMKGAGRRWGTW